MDFTDYLEVALAQVDAWELPEAEFAQAVNEQARLMAGLDMVPTHTTSTPGTSPCSLLEF